MKKLSILMLFVVAVMMVMAPVAFALDTSASVRVVNYGDPCQNPNVAKSSAVFSNATTTIVSTVTNTLAKYVYICNVAATTSSAATLQLVTGSTTSAGSAKCDVSATNLTPAFAIPINSSLYLNYGGMVTKGTVSANICTNSTGTLSGVITYVVQ